MNFFTAEKITYFIIIAVFIFLFAFIGCEEWRIARLNAALDKSNTETAIAKHDAQMCRGTIDRQNELISAHAMDMEKSKGEYEKNVAELRAESGKKRTEVEKLYAHGISCNQELYLIKSQLDGFYAVY
ncbi:MAG: hypothetical protein LBH05_07885 [Deferribacteraceae bacterium]|jgi:hypothetical protein|nr:hypothetical protein [Deferribacteraceae bacterium]